MSGPVELHGGGEYEAGDDTCVSAVLALAAERVGRGGRRPIRVLVVPTATARWDPGRSAAQAMAAYDRVATRDGLTVAADAALVVDAASAADPVIAERLAAADVVPGLVVVPHADAASWSSALERFGAWAPAGLHPIGLGERTAAITVDPTTDPIAWQVVGEGDVRWLPDLAGTPVVLRPGDRFETPGRPRP